MERLALSLFLASLAGCTYYDLHDAHGADVYAPCAPTGHDDGGRPVDLGLAGDPDLGTADAPDAGTPPPPPACTVNADCAAGEVCVEGACVAESAMCHFDVDCGPDRGCIDNACRPFCAVDEDCADGTSCVSGICRPATECTASTDCADGTWCVGGRCLAGCTDASECPAGDLCTAGVCRPDTAPRPFCTTDADCATGHVCLSGVCRTPCPSATDEECQRSDTFLVRCGASGTGPLLCYTAHQWDPACATATDCPSGLSCWDGICR